MNKSAIYIHVPWCRRRCPYCDFYFVVGKPENSYIDAIISEWEYRHKEFGQGPKDSLYFGGGTPSLINPSELNRLLNYFTEKKILADQAEITLEANPEDISDDYGRALFETGVNRISLGVQSLQDDILRILGRKHSSAMAKLAIARMLTLGFRNISVDLILGVKDENIQAIMDSLCYLNDQGIPHISTYLLTIEEGTNLYRRIKKGLMKHPEEDAQVDLYQAVQERLTQYGYVQYDISSYAKPGFLSGHNQVYWGNGGYIGLGPGAHSMRLLADGGIERTHNQSNLLDWLKDPKDERGLKKEHLTPLQALNESLAFGLRNMSLGMRPAILSERHQTPIPKSFMATIEKFKIFGWLEENDGLLKITKKGALFADAIMRDIFACE